MVGIVRKATAAAHKQQSPHQRRANGDFGRQILGVRHLPLGGGEGNRTPGLFDATEALYQLSYTPEGVLRLPRGGVVAERGPPDTDPDATGTGDYQRGERQLA